MQKNRDLGLALLGCGLVTQEDLRSAEDLRSKIGGRIEDIFLKIGALSEDVLLEQKSRFFDVPLLDENQMPDPIEICAFMTGLNLNSDWFLSNKTIVWEEGDKILATGADIFDPSIRETLRHIFDERQVNYRLSSQYQIDRLLIAVKNELSVEALFENSEDERRLRELAEEAPVVEFVSNILAQAIDANASDVHLEPEEKSFNIKMRVDGVLSSKMEQPKERLAAVTSRIKLIAGLDIAERRLPQDGRISTRLGGKEIDIRVSTVPTVSGESIVLRILPKEKKSLELEVLGLERKHISMSRDWAKSSGGIYLITGPTGSGKSTTLHAMLSDANDGLRKIVSVEDPVEIQAKGVTQIQAHSEIGYSFARALRAILRHDPDVIMIGEIRDLETAEIAIQSALSGHLVLSTLHTNDAISSFTRLIDMGVEPFLVSAAVKGVQAQRLVRKVCSNCALPTNPPDEINLWSKSKQAEKSERKFCKAIGCELCQMTGYKGRVGIYQMIQVDSEFKKKILAGESETQLREYFSDRNDSSLMDDGLLKASRGLTTIEELHRVIAAED